MAQETPTRYRGKDGCPYTPGEPYTPATGGQDPALESFDVKLSRFDRTPKKSPIAMNLEALYEAPNCGSNGMADVNGGWEHWEQGWERLSELHGSPTPALSEAQSHADSKLRDEDSIGSDVPPDLFETEGIRSDSVEWESAASARTSGDLGENRDLPSTRSSVARSFGLPATELDYGGELPEEPCCAGHAELQDENLQGSLEAVADCSPVVHRDSVASVTSLRFMRSGVREETPLSPECGVPAVFFAASPCRRVSTPTNSKFTRSGKGSIALDPPSPVAPRDSIGSVTSLRFMQSGMFDKALESPDTSPSNRPRALGNGYSHQSLGRRSSIASAASATSLRFMQSAVRSEFPAASTPTHESQEYLSMVLHMSRVSSPSRSDHASPTRPWLGQTDIDDHRASASFASDQWRLLSPRKTLSPARKTLSPPRQRCDRLRSPDHPAVRPSLPPVHETEEVSDTTAQAISRHPRLFCSPPALEIKNAPQCSQRSSSVHCDEDLELQRDYIALKKALQEEKTQRAKVVVQLEIVEQREAARLQEARLIEELKAEQQRLMDWRENEQERLLEVQRDLQQKGEVLEREQKRFDAERVHFNIERQTVEENRKGSLARHEHDADLQGFLIQHVQYLIKHERELESKGRNLEAFEKVLNDTKRVHDEETAVISNGVAEHTQELRDKIARFEEQKQKLDDREASIKGVHQKLKDREARLAERVQQFAETEDRASQTPVFRTAVVRRTVWRRLFGFSMALMVLLCIWASGRTMGPRTQGWLCHITDAWERYGYSLQCPAGLKLRGLDIPDFGNSSSSIASIVSSTTAMSIEPQAIWRAPVAQAELSRYSGHFGGVAGGICGVMFYWCSP